MYFVAEMSKAQASPYVFEEVGNWLDYYILYVDDLSVLEMDLRNVEPITITEKEYDGRWFTGLYYSDDQKFIKVEGHDWEKFGREKRPEYKISQKGKIYYPISRQEEDNAVSLMRKILAQKIDVFIKNQKLLDMYTPEVESIQKEIIEQLNIGTDVADMYNVWNSMMINMYQKI